MKPRWQELHPDNVPVRKEGDSEIRVYSGTSMGMTAPTLNETPTILVDFNFSPDFEVAQNLPVNYNGFVYIIEGKLEVGLGRTLVDKGQVAWAHAHSIPLGHGLGKRLIFRVHQL